MERWVDITFDCLPLRTITRMDVPMDASPKYRAKCEAIQSAVETHGTHNSYYLHNAHCIFHVVNSEKMGEIDFSFSGTVLTDSTDQVCKRSDLQVELHGETVDWLNQPITDWFAETVSHAVREEFNRYIAAGDLEKARERVAKIEAASDDAGGFVGMYL